MERCPACHGQAIGCQTASPSPTAPSSQVSGQNAAASTACFAASAGAESIICARRPTGAPENRFPGPKSGPQGHKDAGDSSFQATLGRLADALPGRRGRGGLGSLGECPNPRAWAEVPGMEVPLGGRHGGVQSGGDRAPWEAERQVPRCGQSGPVSARMSHEPLDRCRPVEVRELDERFGIPCPQVLHTAEHGGGRRPARPESSHWWYQPATARTCRASSTAVQAPQAVRVHPSGVSSSAAARNARTPSS